MARPRTSYDSIEAATEAATRLELEGRHDEAVHARRVAGQMKRLQASKRPVKVDPETGVGYVTATSVKPYQQAEPVEVFERSPAFTARNAGHALAKIGDWFGAQGATDDDLFGAVNRIFEFVVDSHRFTVAIDPVDGER